MSRYVIGDVQGCYDELRGLLNEINFQPARDSVWFTGDLINRGPKSAEVLRFVSGLGDRAVTVLGNHDLHTLAIAAGKASIKNSDTIGDVLDAPDGDELMRWLQMQPLLHHDVEHNATMIHAGLAPQWTLATARALAREIENTLQGAFSAEFFAHMYGNFPDQWDDALAGWDRARFITNTFTRLRFCDGQGKQLLKEKGAVGSQPPGFMPWFEVPTRANRGQLVLFGHWAALGAGHHGDVISLDSGCAWGGQLTALRLDGQQRFFSVSCARYSDSD